MKTIIILLVIILTSFVYDISAQCVQCEGGNNPGTNASIIGTNNLASGNSSFAGGKDSEAQGKQSFAFGENTLTMSAYSVAMGQDVTTFGGASIVLGRNLMSTSSSIILGRGFDDDNRLMNTTPNCLIVGFNSTKPTFFISESKNGANSTGKIGIGNVTNPQAKLHIRADENYDTASVYIETFNDNKPAYLWMGNKNFGLHKHSTSLEFLSDGNYVFNSGNVGIGTSSPGKALEVVGNIKTDGLETMDLDITGDIAIGTSYPHARLHVYSQSGRDPLRVQVNGATRLWLRDNGGLGVGNYATPPARGLYVYGNVGIGTSSPSEKLEVAGNILQPSGWLHTTPQIKAPDLNGLRLTDKNNIGIFIEDGGNVGIGTDNPDADLEVNGNIKALAIDVGNFKMATNGFAEGKILQSKADGSATWIDPPLTNDGDWVISGQNVYRASGMVGIGTSNPTAQLTLSDIYEAGGLNLLVGNDAYLSDIDQTHTLGILSKADNNIGAIKLGLQGPKLYGNEGCLGIGTTQTDTYMLAVAGSIRATEVQIEHITDWYDCVFEDDYELPSLSDIETFVKENKHLPELPSEEEVMEQGINLGEMNALLLKKVEELTLHLIEQQKQMKKQQSELIEQQKQIDELKNVLK